MFYEGHLLQIGVFQRTEGRFWISWELVSPSKDRSGVLGFERKQKLFFGFGQPGVLPAISKNI